MNLPTPPSWLKSVCCWTKLRVISLRAIGLNSVWSGSACARGVDRATPVPSEPVQWLDRTGEKYHTAWIETKDVISVRDSLSKQGTKSPNHVGDCTGDRGMLKSRGETRYGITNLPPGPPVLMRTGPRYSGESSPSGDGIRASAIEAFSEVLLA